MLGKTGIRDCSGSGVEGLADCLHPGAVETKIGMAQTGSRAEMDLVLGLIDQEFDIVDIPHEESRKLDM